MVTRTQVASVVRARIYVFTQKLGGGFTVWPWTFRVQELVEFIA